MLKTLIPHVIFLLIASFIPAPALATPMSIQPKSLITEAMIFEQQAVSDAPIWMTIPYSDKGVRQFRYRGSSLFSDRKSMSPEQFSQLLDEILQSLGKNARLYNNSERTPLALYQNLRVQLDQINFLLHLIDPKASIGSNSYWTAVFIGVLPYLQAEGAESRLGLCFNQARFDTLNLIADEYGLPHTVLADELLSLKKNIRDQHGNWLPNSDNDRERVKQSLQAESPTRWKNFIDAVQISFPKPMRRADIQKTEAPYFKATAVTGMEFEMTTQSLLKEIDRVLKTLSPQQEEVIKRRFGLGEFGDSQTLEEVALEMTLDREKIRQIEAKALRKLRHPLRSQRLSKYFPEMPEPRKRGDSPREVNYFALELEGALQAMGIPSRGAHMFANAVTTAPYILLQELYLCGVIVEADVGHMYHKEFSLLNMGHLTFTLKKLNVEQFKKPKYMLRDMVNLLRGQA